MRKHDPCGPTSRDRYLTTWIGASAEAAVKRATVLADGFLPPRPFEGGWTAMMTKVHDWRRTVPRREGAA